MALLAAAGPAGSEQAAGGGLSFRRIPMPDDVPAHLCSALAQDRDGFLWIGTQGGLVRYDGFGFRVFRADASNPHALAGSYIRALLAASDGRIWAGTFSAGVSVYDPATDRFSTYRSNSSAGARLSHDRVEGLVEDRAGRVWIATYEGLDRFDPRSGVIDHFRANPADAASLADDRTRGLLVDRAGQLWVGSRNGLQIWREPGRFERVASDPLRPGSLAGQFVAKLYEDSRGRIWIGTTEHGAAVLDPRTGQLRRIAASASERGASHDWVYGIEAVGTGEMWIATFGGGIEIVDPGSLEIIGHVRHDPARETSIGGDRIGSLLKDRSGVVWAGSWGQGLARYDPSARAFQAIRHSPNLANGLTHPAAVRSLQLRDGSIWIGTNGNGIDIYDPGRGVIGGHRARPLDPGALSDGSITCLAQSPDGTVWVATLNGVLHRMRPGATRFERTTTADGLPGGPIRALTFGPRGELWAGSAEGLARVDPVSNTITSFRHRPGDDSTLSGYAVEAIAFGRDGTMWVGTDSGLNAFDPIRGVAVRIVSEPGRPDSLPNNWIPDLMVADDGRLWVGTQGGACILQAWDGRTARFERVADRIKRAAGPAESLVQDADGWVWIGATLRVDPRTWQSQEFGPADGREFRSFFIASRTRTADGSLAFGSPEGLLLVRPELIQPWTFEPPVAVTALSIDGQPRPGAARIKELRLQPSERGFTVDFAALDLTAPERNVYRYRLHGFDPEWIVTDASRRSATYTNLPPGDYTLRVEGSNRAGRWSPSAIQLGVIVLPAFYQTTWFRFSMGALGLALAYTGYRIRVRRLQARSRELEQLVGERTEELQSAYARIEEASLADALTGLRNRRFIEQAIGPEVARSVRAYEGHDAGPERDLVFLLLDLDHFKSVNDTYGHAAGDAVLVQTAAVLRGVFRASDFLVRWGGEEFLVVLRFVDREQGSELAEKIRAAIAAHAFRLPDGTVLTRTCSVGFAAFPFAPARPRAVTWETVIDVADAGLYRAKRTGRDRWVGIATAGDADPAETVAAIKADLQAAIARGVIICHSR